MTAEPVTAPDDGAAGGHLRRAGRPPAVSLAHAVERDERLDPAVAALRPVADALVASPQARSVLLGRQLGHAVHPLLTDAPIGAWMSALVLDLAGGAGAEDAARKLVGVGILSAVPTALTGVAEWSHTEQRDARVGVVHAASNGVALALWTASYVARRRGRRRAGIALGLAGGLATGVGGFFGSHLAIARNVGTRDATLAESFPATGPDVQGQQAVSAD